jgi:hypothetical protein
MNSAVCKKVIEELIKEESMEQFKTNIPEKQEEAKQPATSEEDSLFVVQDFEKSSPEKKKTGQPSPTK